MSTPTVTCLLGGTGPVASRSEEGGERRAIGFSTLYEHTSLFHQHQYHSQMSGQSNQRSCVRKRVMRDCQSTSDAKSASGKL